MSFSECEVSRDYSPFADFADDELYAQALANRGISAQHKYSNDALPQTVLSNILKAPVEVRPAVFASLYAHEGQERWNKAPYATHTLRAMSSMMILTGQADAVTDSETGMKRFFDRLDMLSFSAIGPQDIRAATEGSVLHDAFEDSLEKMNHLRARGIYVPKIHEDSITLAEDKLATPDEFGTVVGKIEYSRSSAKGEKGLLTVAGKFVDTHDNSNPDHVPGEKRGKFAVSLTRYVDFYNTLLCKWGGDAMEDIEARSEAVRSLYPDEGMFKEIVGKYYEIIPVGRSEEIDPGQLAVASVELASAGYGYVPNERVSAEIAELKELPR